MWVLYKRFLKTGLEQNENTITQKYDKNENVRTGKSSSFFVLVVVVVVAALLLLLRFVVASALPLF